MKKFKTVGIIGTRGIPNTYGGFERFLEVLVDHPGWGKSSVRFKIYGESPDREYNSWTSLREVGMSKKDRPLAYYYRSTVLATSECDIILCCGVGISVFAYWPALRGKRLIVNPDGCEWRRTKWSPLGRQLIKFMYAPALAAATDIVIDAEALREDFGSSLGGKARYIPYQAPDPATKELSNKTRERFKIAQSYVLVIARLEPENNVRTIVEAFSLLPEGDVQLLIVGPTSTQFYTDQLAGYASSRIRFLGAIFDQDVLHELRSNCIAYLHGHSVGGTNPSLLEALSTVRGEMICHDNKYNREVAGDGALYFADTSELQERLKDCIAKIAPQGKEWARVPYFDKRFHPDTIFEEYLKLFEGENAAH